MVPPKITTILHQLYKSESCHHVKGKWFPHNHILKVIDLTHSFFFFLGGGVCGKYIAKSLQTKVFTLLQTLTVVTELKLKSWWRRSWDRAQEWTWMNEKWFEACRCFHILKEINICVHSDCTVLLQINNHNHKRPGDWLSIELSFFSLWQIWILLLQASQMTLLLWCVYVYMCSVICVLRAFKFHLSQWSMCVI